MLKKGDLVRFRSRTQAMQYMIVEEVNTAPLFNDNKYKMRNVQGWWSESNLEKVGDNGRSNKLCM